MYRRWRDEMTPEQVEFLERVLDAGGVWEPGLDDPGSGDLPPETGGVHPLALRGERVATRLALAARAVGRRSLRVGKLYEPLEWAFWAANDIGRRFRYGDETHLYGIKAYVGLFGGGKTISMIERAHRDKEFYKDRLKVWSNVPCAFADGPIRGFNHMRDCYMDGFNHLFCIDEIHLTWATEDWKKIDPDVMMAMTQMRKYGGGFAIYYTTQRLNQTATVFRRLASEIVECSGWPTNRWIHQVAYSYEDYNEGQPRRMAGSQEDYREVLWRHRFIADDFIRSQYRTDWVAQRLVADGEAGIIGEEAVRQKMAQEAEAARAMVEVRMQEDQLAGAHKLARSRKR